MKIENTNRPQFENSQPSEASTPSSDTIRGTAKTGHARFSSTQASGKPLRASRFNSYLSTFAKVGLVAIAVAALVPKVSAYYYCEEVCESPRLVCTSWIETNCNWYGCWDYLAERCKLVEDCWEVCY